MLSGVASSTRGSFPADELPVRRPQIERRRRAEVHFDDGTAVKTVCRGSSHHSVRAEFGRIVVANLYPRARPVVHHERTSARVVRAHMLYRIVERRRDGGHHRAVHVVEGMPALTEQVVNDHTVLVRGVRSHGGHPPGVRKLVALENAYFDIGVSYVHCKKHKDLPRPCASARRIYE